MIDFHAHILPHADHGSDSVDTSLEQLRRAKAVGVTQIVATPHFYPAKHRVERFLEKRARAAAALREAPGGTLVPFLLGAEVLLCPGLEHMEGLAQLCVEGSHTLLLELPFCPLSSEMVETVAALSEEGTYSIILAHADRYAPAEVKKVLPYAQGVQLNVASLAGLFTFGKCRPYLQSGTVCAIGSDIHQKGNQYRAFAKACRRLGSELDGIMAKTAALIGTENPSGRE